MCNLYRKRSGQQTTLDLAREMRPDLGNLAPGDVYPGYAAPIARAKGEERALTSVRGGMPSSEKALTARMVWAIMTSGERYREPLAA